MCSAYNWSFEEAKKLTVPQVMMLNHASWLEQENGEIRYQHKKAVEAWEEEHTVHDPFVGEFGKALSEMTELETNAYFADWSSFG